MENTITLNQYNIIGKKIDVDINKIRNNEKIEDVVLKNFNITNEIIKVLETLKNLRRIWFIKCNIIEKVRIQNVESFRIENSENIQNISFGEKIKNIYINNCKEFDINTIMQCNLKELELEYTIPNNLQMLQKIKTLENLSLKEIDLTNTHLSIPISLKKINLNGSKVANKDVVIKYFKDKNIKIEFYDKNLPIG